MISFKRNGNELTVFLHGEIDHRAVEGMRRQIDTMLEKSKPHHLRFDFSDVTFMDSSGIGMMIGRYKKVMSWHGSVSACGFNETMDRLFTMAGLHRIITVERAEEEQNT